MGIGAERLIEGGGGEGVRHFWLSFPAPLRFPEFGLLLMILGANFRGPLH